MNTNKSLRVVVVDDNRDTTDSLAILLKMAGYEVHVAYDGEGALQLCSSCCPDVLLVDIAMPKMDGNRLAEKVRQTSGCKDTLMIAMTGYSDEEHRLQSEKVGFNVYLVKPMDLDYLDRTLKMQQAKNLKHADTDR